MKIYVPTLPEAGRLFRFSEQEVWVQNMLAERLHELTKPQTPLSGYVQLLRTNTNVSLSGHADIILNPSCDRCAQSFSLPMSVSLQRYLVPYFPKPEASLQNRNKAEEEELELQEEDLNFSTYDEEEIDLAEILAEEILLALPMRFLCSENCLGLCINCGTNLNEASCNCQQQNKENPFQILQGVKFPESK